MDYVKSFLKEKIGFTNQQEETELKREVAYNEAYDQVDLQICWILDITGSMSSSIAACKQASSQTAELISSQGYNVGFVMSTYTENSKGSYVSYDKFYEVDKAVDFIKKITLCRPPNNPSVSASGEDGDENLKHAMADFSSKHNFNIPSVVFIITDAGYHKIGASSETAKRERESLKEYNAQNDLFKIWNTWNKETSFVFPLTIGVPSSFNDYAQFAKDSDGISFVFKSLSGSGSEMSKVQVVMINEIFGRLSGDTAQVAPNGPPIEKFSAIVNSV